MPCYEEAHHDASIVFWDRVMRMEDSQHHKGAGVLCTQKDLDVVDLCKKNRAQPDTSTAPGAMGSMIPADGSPYTEQYMDINVRDCDVLANVVNPYCAFTPPADFGRGFHKKVKEGGGYTIEFWIKILAQTHIPRNNAEYAADSTSMRRMVFFSKVSPPRVLASVSLRSAFEDVELQMFGNCYKYNKAKVVQDFPKATPLKTEEWFKLSLVFGIKDAEGRRGIEINQGSLSAFQYMEELGWCESDDDFISTAEFTDALSRPEEAVEVVVTEDVSRPSSTTDSCSVAGTASTDESSSPIAPTKPSSVLLAVEEFTAEKTLRAKWSDDFTYDHQMSEEEWKQHQESVQRKPSNIAEPHQN